ncbi:MAG: GNAT family N-acetyltransferase [Flavobacteriaceae bacterium]
MEHEIFISTDKSKMDIDFIHEYLSAKSYWAKGRSKERVEKSIAHSLCFGLFKGWHQIGFARVATDYVVFAWVMDLFVDPVYRDKGLGRKLIQSIVDHPELQDVNGIGLRTKDAHELYEKYNFKSISDPETWMFRKKK